MTFGSNHCKYSATIILFPSGINNKWKGNVYVARINNAHIVAEMIEIRDCFTFKECCILSNEDWGSIIEHLTAL